RARPNPLHSRTTIEYTVPAAGRVTLELFDVSGRKVASLVDGERTAGPHRVEWTPPRGKGGLYFYRLKAGGRTLVQQRVVTGAEPGLAERRGGRGGGALGRGGTGVGIRPAAPRLFPGTGVARGVNPRGSACAAPGRGPQPAGRGTRRSAGGRRSGRCRSTSAC